MEPEGSISENPAGAGGTSQWTFVSHCQLHGTRVLRTATGSACDHWQQCQHRCWPYASTSGHATFNTPQAVAGHYPVNVYPHQCQMSVLSPPLHCVADPPAACCRHQSVLPPAGLTSQLLYHHHSNPQLSDTLQTAAGCSMPVMTPASSAARCRSIPHSMETTACGRTGRPPLVHQDSAPTVWYCDDPACVMPPSMSSSSATITCPATISADRRYLFSLHRCNSQPAGLCRSTSRAGGAGGGSSVAPQSVAANTSVADGFYDEDHCDSSPPHSERVVACDPNARHLVSGMDMRPSDSNAASFHSAGSRRAAHGFRNAAVKQTSAVGNQAAVAATTTGEWAFHSSTSSSESRDLTAPARGCFSPSCSTTSGPHLDQAQRRRKDWTLARAREQGSAELYDPESVASLPAPAPPSLAFLRHTASSFSNDGCVSDGAANTAVSGVGGAVSSSCSGTQPPTRLDPSAVYLRAQFSYDPSRDTELPCPNAGLTFKVGDILQVVRKDDVNWWHAINESKQSNVGLVPSPALQKFRLSCAKGNNLNKGGHSFFSRKKKQAKQNKSATLQSISDIPTYEEVARCRSFARRTLVLIGAHGVGRRHIKKSLILSQPDKFAYPVPHTTREKRDDEIDGRQYFFISHQAMMKGITDKDFLEYGQHEDAMYGTRLDTIRSIHNSGKMAILDVEAEALKVLRCRQFAPLVVFIAAPRLLGVTELDSSLERLVRDSDNIRANFGHTFDLTLVNYDIERTITTLQQHLESLNLVPQWVPVSWLQ